MTHTIQEILSFIEENDVKFIRLAFCDIWGAQKNISVMPNQVTRMFEEGIMIDGSSIQGFTSIENSDLLLFPDPLTFDILPWRPQSGSVIRFFCEVRNLDGTPFECDTRFLLRRRVDEIKKNGYLAMSGMECEFYLFKLNEEGMNTWIPHDNASYLDIAPVDKGENIRRDICLTLEEMGIEPESSHHEMGPGQNEIDFQYRDALTSCDQLITFKWAVQTIADLHDVHASFLPKPIKDKSGSGLHINLSLVQKEVNAFDLNDNELLNHFIAGILKYVKEMTLFLNPTENSYERFGSYEAPKHICYGHRNRYALVRVPEVSEDLVRCEIRSADPLCNPYLATNLLLAAGIEGVNQKLALMDEVTYNPFVVENDLDVLPSSLEEAIECAKNSAFIKKYLPRSVIDFYIENKMPISTCEGECLEF